MFRAVLKHGRYSYRDENGKKKTVLPGKSLRIENKSEIPTCFHDQWEFKDLSEQKPVEKKETVKKSTKRKAPAKITKRKAPVSKKEEDKSESEETENEEKETE